MAIPVIRVEFDAKPRQAGEFLLDTSALDGTDTLATSPRWVDVSTLDDAVITGRITQGRQNVDNPVAAGTCVLTCDNFTGNYDPDQVPGVFYPYLLKGMLCRVSAVIGGTPYGMFTGRLDDAQVDKGYDLEATLTFVDDLQIAGNTQMTSYDNSVRPESTLSRATWLTNMLYPNLTASPVLSTTLTRQLLPTYGGGTVLDMLNVVVTAEQGHLFVDDAGVLTVTAHSDDLTSPLLVTLSDDLSDVAALDYQVLTTSAGRTQVVVGAIVDAYNRNDSNYPSMYGGNVGGSPALGAVVSVVAPLSVDADRQALANYLATRRSTPPPSIDAVTVDFSQAGSEVLIGAPLGNQLIVHRTVPYTTGAQVINLQAVIEGTSYDFSVSGLFGTFYLATADITSLFGGLGPFRLDSSSLDGPDILAAY